MTLFAQREQAFENMFAHEETMRFRAKAHRNKAVAAWAAALMTKPLTERTDYQQAIVDLSVQNGEDDVVVERIRNDLGQAGYPVSPTLIRSKMDVFMTQAQQAVRL